MGVVDRPEELHQQPLSETTKRMVSAITCDDYEECEDAILQGADVNVDAGGGMTPLHISSLRGESYLTELLIAHGARINQRDLCGNTPLLYSTHFWNQHNKGVQMTSQLLYHRADPCVRVVEGKMAGMSSMDIIEQACRQPQMDETTPRQIRALLQLAVDDVANGRTAGCEAATRAWMAFKSQDKRLYSVSSKDDRYEYSVKSRDWATPGGVPPEAFAPKVIASSGEAFLEEKFTWLKDYSFSDEGDKVKVYVTFPGHNGLSSDLTQALQTEGALHIDFDFQSFDLKLRLPDETYRLRLDPLFGSIDISGCKYRVSASSAKLSLTLKKRHTNRRWMTLLKPN